ncbi:hypothetical protein ACM64Y_17130 [Novispirillum sp. DQ9]|uniref:hypothetical protein n=1 Tax=Novispirillum sp. DQ9 TaxID=3398612 RepID=UPI003C799140
MVVEKDMALTPAEFRRSLPGALRGLDWRLDSTDGGGDIAHVATADGTITIRCAPLPPRRLTALLSMPRCLVTLDLGALAEAARAPFLTRFDRAFQRGGG